MNKQNLINLLQTNEYIVIHRWQLTDKYYVAKITNENAQILRSKQRNEQIDINMLNGFNVQYVGTISAPTFHKMNMATFSQIKDYTRQRLYMSFAYFYNGNEQPNKMFNK